MAAGYYNDPETGELLCGTFPSTVHRMESLPPPDETNRGSVSSAEWLEARAPELFPRERGERGLGRRLLDAYGAFFEEFRK